MMVYKTKQIMMTKKIQEKFEGVQASSKELAAKGDLGGLNCMTRQNEMKLISKSHIWRQKNFRTRNTSR